MPTVALYLGVVSVGLLPLGWLVDTLATVVELVSRSAGNVLVVVGGVAIVLSPFVAIAAIFTGARSVRRFPDHGFGRAGLILGCVALALLVVIGLLFVITWFSIRSK